MTYTLEHRPDSPDAQWSTVAANLAQPNYVFGMNNPPEGAGAWRYRLRTVDALGTPSDWTPPNKPR